MLQNHLPNHNGIYLIKISLIISLMSGCIDDSVVERASDEDEMNAGESNLNVGGENAGGENAGEMNAGEMNAGEMNAGDDVVQIAGDSLQVVDDDLNQDQPERDMGTNMDIEENPSSYGCDLKPNNSHTAMHFLLVLILSIFGRRKLISADYS